jgi:hypothetical protein
MGRKIGQGKLDGRNIFIVVKLSVAVFGRRRLPRTLLGWRISSVAAPSCLAVVCVLHFVIRPLFLLVLFLGHDVVSVIGQWYCCRVN